LIYRLCRGTTPCQGGEASKLSRPPHRPGRQQGSNLIALSLQIEGIQTAGKARSEKKKRRRYDGVTGGDGAAKKKKKKRRQCRRGQESLHQSKTSHRLHNPMGMFEKKKHNARYIAEKTEAANENENAGIDEKMKILTLATDSKDQTDEKSKGPEFLGNSKKSA